MTVDLFTPQDTAVPLNGHQEGAMGWIRSAPIEQVKANALALAKAAGGEGQGPLMPEPRDIAPPEYGTRIRRSGMVNALEDQDFVTAVKPPGGRIWSLPESPPTSAPRTRP
ncbi:hypothetical protein ACQPWW_09610 [Micromonospora sp. CA-240977]|uniref:hypothetical protein n=1 Tax=Micromonospora sp. CA-240977 TaxID=3239957 RepID=UPI003D936830